LYANAGALDNALKAATRAIDTMPAIPIFNIISPSFWRAWNDTMKHEL